MAYYQEHEPWLENVYAEIGKEPSLAFVAHVGDLSRPVRACTEETLKLRLSQFNALPQPVIFTPGDNDWTDCHDQQGVKGGDPLAALDRLRTMFFAGEESLGKRKMRVTRQSQSPQYAKFRENLRWDISGVTFVTLHIPGSNNNLGRTPEGDAEYRERNAANLVWLQQAFVHASRWLRRRPSRSRNQWSWSMATVISSGSTTRSGGVRRAGRWVLRHLKISGAWKRSGHRTITGFT